MAALARAAARLPRLVLLAFIALWVLIPIYFLVATSLTPRGTTIDGLALPSKITLDNYRSIFSGQSAIWRPLLASTVVTVSSTLLALLVAVPAAYGLSHMRRRRAGRMAYLSFFVLRGIPPIALVLPFYLLFSKSSLLNTLYGLIIALTPLALPYCVWTLRVTFDQIPLEVEEAGAIDGASTWKVFTAVALPIAAPGISAAGILSALFIYVDYIITSALAGPDTFTFPIYVTSFNQDFVTLIGPLSAASIIGAIPMAILFVLSQRFARRLASAGIH